MFRLAMSLLIVALGTAGTAHARVAISLSNAIVDFAPAGPRFQDIMVNNMGDEIAYVSITGEEVLAPGLPNESRRALTAKDTDLLVSPQKLVIPPDSQKKIRFISRIANSPAERIFRFSVIPVLPEGEKAAPGMAVRVVVGYGILVIVRPDPLQHKVAAVRQGKHITFTNAGNTNVFLETGRQCAAGGKPGEVCPEVHGQRLYSGQTWSQELPADAPVEYSFRVGETAYTEIFGQQPAAPPVPQAAPQPAPQ